MALIPRPRKRYLTALTEVSALVRKHPDRARMLLRRYTVGDIRLEPKNDHLEAVIEANGTRMALDAGAIASPREIGGNGGRIYTCEWPLWVEGGHTNSP